MSSSKSYQSPNQNDWLEGNNQTDLLDGNMYFRLSETNDSDTETGPIHT